MIQRQVEVVNRRHDPTKEPPSFVYVALKLYSTIRPKDMITVLYTMGICLNYRRIIEIANSLTEAQLQNFEKEGAVIPGK